MSDGEALEGDHYRRQERYIPIIQERSLPNIPNPSPTDGMVLLPK